MRWISIIIVLFICKNADSVNAQSTLIATDFSLLENRIAESVDTVVIADYNNNVSTREEYPSPKSVMRKSMIIPGWGQIENRQIWKVPIIYGLFTGIGFYTVHLNSDYQDHRAAFYNSFPDNDDFRFGPTPDRLANISPNQLQSNRNSLRNQRDFMFVVMGLAYGLNVLDAYVFAHMRSFDVSDDLSANTILLPVIMAEGSPGITLKISLYTK